MQSRACRGFSLVELMCVIAIIAIMASLLAGPALRALDKAKALEWEHANLTDEFRDSLRKHFGNSPAYPEFSRDALFEAGIVSRNVFEFLKDKRVRYVPFSSRDPDEKIILEVRVSHKDVRTLTKASVRPPED